MLRTLQPNRWPVPKTLILGITILALVAASVGGYLYRQRLLAAQVGPAFVTQTVKTGNIQKAVKGTGTIALSQIETLSSPGTGSVTAVNVKVGDKVQAGQTLVTINLPDLQIGLAAVQSNLASAQSL